MKEDTKVVIRRKPWQWQRPEELKQSVRHAFSVVGIPPEIWKTSMKSFHQKQVTEAKKEARMREMLRMIRELTGSTDDDDEDIAEVIQLGHRRTDR